MLATIIGEESTGSDDHVLRASAAGTARSIVERRVSFNFKADESDVLLRNSDRDGIAQAGA
jgi:hypothetical protein